MEVGEEATRATERERWLAGRLHHRRPVEPLHDEVAIARVVDLGTRIALRSHVPHDLRLGDQRPPISREPEHPARPVLEDLAVRALGQLRSQRLHDDHLRRRARHRGRRRGRRRDRPLGGCAFALWNERRTTLPKGPTRADDGSCFSSGVRHGRSRVPSLLSRRSLALTAGGAAAGAAPGARAPMGPTASAPSGEAMPLGDLPGWRQVFADDFTTDVPLGSFPAAVSDRWGAYPSPAKDTSKYGTYSPKKIVSVSGGLLNSHIHTENGVSMVSAPIPKLPRPMTYGRYAIRFRFDRMPGYKMAWMLWPDSGGNRLNGEIDFPEMNLDSTNVMGFMHRTNSTGSNDQAWAKAQLSAGSWHTAVIEWTPNQVVFVYDGREDRARPGASPRRRCTGSCRPRRHSRPTLPPIRASAATSRSTGPLRGPMTPRPPTVRAALRRRSRRPSRPAGPGCSPSPRRASSTPASGAARRRSRRGPCSGSRSPAGRRARRCDRRSSPTSPPRRAPPTAS